MRHAVGATDEAIAATADARARCVAKAPVTCRRERARAFLFWLTIRSALGLVVPRDPLFALSELWSCGGRYARGPALVTAGRGSRRWLALAALRRALLGLASFTFDYASGLVSEQRPARTTRSPLQRLHGATAPPRQVHREGSRRLSPRNEVNAAGLRARSGRGPTRPRGDDRHQAQEQPDPLDT